MAITSSKWPWIGQSFTIRILPSRSMMVALISPTFSFSRMLTSCLPSRIDCRASRTHVGHSESVSRGHPRGGFTFSHDLRSGLSDQFGVNPGLGLIWLNVSNTVQAPRAAMVRPFSTYLIGLCIVSPCLCLRPEVSQEISPCAGFPQRAGKFRGRMAARPADRARRTGPDGLSVGGERLYCPDAQARHRPRRRRCGPLRRLLPERDGHPGEGRRHRHHRADQPRQQGDARDGRRHGASQAVAQSGTDASKTPSLDNIGDLFDEAKIREQASSFGLGVRYVSSAPIARRRPDGRQGDVRLRRRPPAQPEQPSGRGDADAATALRARSRPRPVTRPSASASRKAGPRPPMPRPRRRRSPQRPDLPPEALAMVRNMFKGAKINVAVEVDGAIVTTDGPKRDGSRVTIFGARLRAAPQRPGQVLGAAGPEAGRRLRDRAQGARRRPWRHPAGEPDGHHRVPLTRPGAMASAASPGSAVPAAQVTPPGLSYIARSTTIGTGAAPMLSMIALTRWPTQRRKPVADGDVGPAVSGQRHDQGRRRLTRVLGTDGDTSAAGNARRVGYQQIRFGVRRSARLAAGHGPRRARCRGADGVVGFVPDRLRPPHRPLHDDREAAEGREALTVTIEFR